MKFWLTLVVSVVAISGFITWAAMKGGGSYGTKLPHMPKGPPDALSKAPPPPPKLVFHFRPDQKEPKLDADVVQIDVGDSVLNQESEYAFGFKNHGQGPLEITLEDVKCGCINNVLIGKSPRELQKMQIKGPAMIFGPEELGVVLIRWKPEETQLPEGVQSLDKTFRFYLGTNERLYSIRQIELNTRLVRPRETKS